MRGLRHWKKPQKDAIISMDNYFIKDDSSLAHMAYSSKPKSPFALNYESLFKEPGDMYVLNFINGVIVVKGCIHYQSYRAMCWNKSKEDCDNIKKSIRFCVPDKNNSLKPFSIRKLLKGVSPKHKIEFARSIITKDGHIISAYLGGIEKDLGKAKANEIAKKLAGQEPQYDMACEITENAKTGTKTINAVIKKGYFCLAE